MESGCRFRKARPSAPPASQETHDIFKVQVYYCPAEAMEHAFNGIANVLLDAGKLTEQLLESDIPALVWDSAIAGGWWRLASETPKRIFPEQIGHYSVWR